jgi:molecular chaperone DnaJ
MEDLYKILELDNNATSSDIKKAYKRLALKYHPDKNNGSKESEEKFKQISNAYSILSDEEKKSQYDRFGTTGNQNPFGGGSGVPFEDLFSQFGDIFGSFGNRRQQQRRKGSDLRMTVSLTLNDIIFGVRKKIKYNRNVKCDTCDGKGGEDIVNCGHCNGTGHRSYVQNTAFGSIRQTAVCSHCSGNGKSVKNPCKKCHGQGVVVKQETVDVEIPKGAVDGNYMSMPQYGNHIKDGIPGDLQIIIDEIPDSKFKREDINLIYDETIPVIDAILGVEKSIKTPHNTDIKYTILPGTSHGKLLRVVGKGIPDMHGRMGDLFIRINIKIPTSITSDEKNILRDLGKSNNFK